MGKLDYMDQMTGNAILDTLIEIKIELIKMNEKKCVVN